MAKSKKFKWQKMNRPTKLTVIAVILERAEADAQREKIPQKSRYEQPADKAES